MHELNGYVGLGCMLLELAKGVTGCQVDPAQSYDGHGRKRTWIDMEFGWMMSTTVVAMPARQGKLVSPDAMVVSR